MAATLRDNFTGDTADGNLVMNAANDWGGQSFTTTVAYSLTRIDIYIAKTPDADIGVTTVALFAVDGSGHPAGTVLATGSIASAIVPNTGSAAFVTCTLDSAVNLSNNTKYCIVVHGVSFAAAKTLYWIFHDDGVGASAFAGGDVEWSTTGGVPGGWSTDTTTDCLFKCWGDTAPPSDKTYTKRLIAIGNHEVWQEAVAGTMSELTDANAQINTSNKMNVCVAFQKLFIANEGNLKIADFVNIKLSTADISSGANLPPDRGTILTGGTSLATMIVDYIDAINGTTLIYGKRTSSAIFIDTETVTGTNPAGSVYVGGVSFVLDADEDGPPHWYDWTVYGADATNFGAMPSEAYLVCNFMGCLMLSGNPKYPHQWYMSRQTNPFDWLYAQDDAQSAVAGNDADAGEVGDVIKVNIPYKDDYVVHACANELWYMTGHPCRGGEIIELDLTTGILGDRAFCWDDVGNLYLMCSVGLLKIPPGFGQPENVTIELWPDFIIDLAFDSSLHRITLAFNPEDRGIHIFKTTLADGVSSAWWYDLRTNGLFPDAYAAAHGAFSAVYYKSESPTYRKLVIGCNDGYIRFWDRTAKNDDDIDQVSTPIDSYVGFAPLSLSTHPRKDGIIRNIDLITAGGASGGTYQSDSDDVLCSVHIARTAEQIIEKLRSGTTAAYTKTFTAPGYQKGNLDRRSIRGQWAGIVLSNNTVDESWSMERLIIDTKESGRSL